MPRNYFYNEEKRILRRVVLGILITGIVIAIAAIYPLYNSLSSQIESLNQSYANSQARTLRGQLKRFEDLADQVASRTELKRIQNEVHNGLLSVEDAEQQVALRYQDAIEHIDDLVAAVRLTADGQIMARHDSRFHTLTDNELDISRLKQDGLHYYSEQNDEGDLNLLLVTAAANIRNDAQEVIGTDILLFTTGSLVSAIAGINQLEEVAQYCLFNSFTGNFISFQGVGSNTTARLVYPDPARLEGLSENQPIKTCTVNGERVVVFQHELEGLDWTLLVRVSAMNLYSELAKQMLWLIVLLILLVLAGALYMRINLSPVLKRVSVQGELLARKNRELRLAGMVFDRAQEAIIVTDPELNIEKINPAATRLLELERARQKRKSLNELFLSERTHPEVRKRITAKLASDGAWQGELWYKLPSGSEFPALQSISAVSNPEGAIEQLVHIFNDISVQKSAEEAIRRKALTDQLTQLPNRAGLELKLQSCLTRARENNYKFAVLFMDLDKFKPVNDTHGHAVGDKLLQQIGPRLQDLVRQSDVVSRIGGDEFVILLCGMKNLNNAVRIAKDMVAEMQRPFDVGGLTIQVGASVGIAAYPDHGQTQEDLLKAADKAMYLAKQNGRNRAEIAQPQE